MEKDVEATQYAVQELAECIKELVRLMQIYNESKLQLNNGSTILFNDNRLKEIYKKATSAKNRLDV